MEILFDKPKYTVWDSMVPIISEKNFTRVYLTDEIGEPSLYNELCYKLKTASKAEVFTIYLNTPGGMIDSAMMIIEAINTSKAKVIAEISGTVASAGTIITLACDDVVVADHTAFMIHNYSGGMVGKGHEMKARQGFIDKALNEAFTSFYNGFLSPTEITEVIEGKDLWMGKDEVVARLKGKYTPTASEDSDEPAADKPRRGRPRKD